MAQSVTQFSSFDELDDAAAGGWPECTRCGSFDADAQAVGVCLGVIDKVPRARNPGGGNELPVSRG